MVGFLILRLHTLFLVFFRLGDWNGDDGKRSDEHEPLLFSQQYLFWKVWMCKEMVIWDHWSAVAKTGGLGKERLTRYKKKKVNPSLCILSQFSTATLTDAIHHVIFCHHFLRPLSLFIYFTFSSQNLIHTVYCVCAKSSATKRLVIGRHRSSDDMMSHLSVYRCNMIEEQDACTSAAINITFKGHKRTHNKSFSFSISVR